MSNFRVAVFIVVGFLFLVSWSLGFWPSTRAIPGEDGQEQPGSIATLEKVELGGMEQWILIRGKDRSQPVLLWLHGGPGAAQMPLAHNLDRELEEEYVVVHWDQRGAGKSNPRDFDESTMTLQQYLDDAHELTRYLQERLGQDRIYLLGHSWGSLLGARLVQEYPEDYQAYIGVGQLVDNHQRVGYQWLQEAIAEQEDERSRQTLEELGEPPYREHQEYLVYADLIDAYGGSFDLPMSRLMFIALRAPEYGVWDYGRWMSGANRGSGPMWEETGAQHLDLRQEVPVLEVPVYFLVGARDYNTPLALVEDYYELLEAPGKELVVFPESAHTPFLGEPEEFNRQMRRVKEETWEQDG